MLCYVPHTAQNYQIPRGFIKHIFWQFPQAVKNSVTLIKTNPGLAMAYQRFVQI